MLAPRRGRGRPPKHALLVSGKACVIADDNDTNLYASAATSSEVVAGRDCIEDDCLEDQDREPPKKRKRGRPRKYPRTDADDGGDADSDVSVDVHNEPSSLGGHGQKITDNDLRDWKQQFTADCVNADAPATVKKHRSCDDRDGDYVEPEKYKAVDKLVRFKGDAEYKSLSKTQRRETIVAYFEGAGNKNYQQTHDYFFRERGWPGASVTFYLKQHTDPNFAPPGIQRKFDHDAIKDYYREALARVGDDACKLKFTELAKALDVPYNAFCRVINEDEEFREQIDAADLAKELSFEARRSVVIAYFIGAKGDYRERRNACVRHFTRVLPFLKQKMILEIVDRFVKTGSVRNIERNCALHWEKARGKGVKYGKNSELDGDELAYLQNVQSLQEEAERGAEIRRSKQSKSPQLLNGDADEAEQNLSTANLRAILREKCDRIAALNKRLRCAVAVALRVSVPYMQSKMGVGNTKGL